MWWMNWYTGQYLDNRGPASLWKHNYKRLPRAKKPQVTNRCSLIVGDCGLVVAEMWFVCPGEPSSWEQLWTGDDAPRQAAGLRDRTDVTAPVPEKGARYRGMSVGGGGKQLQFFILLRSVFFKIIIIIVMWAWQPVEVLCRILKIPWCNTWSWCGAAITQFLRKTVLQLQMCFVAVLL